MLKINGRSCLILLSAVAVAYVSDASAQVTNAGILNNVTTQFHTQAASWAGVIQGYATWLFWTLGTISLVWTGGTLILKKADIGEFFAEFIRFCLFFGFFLWLLNNGAAIGSAIISSLIQIGANASQTGVSNPSGVMDIGFDIFNKVMAQTSIWSPTDSIIGALLAGVTLIVIALIAANMTLMLCSAWILLYAGIFFLGFGGSRWTSEIALHYYRTLLGIAVSLMAMILMVGIAQNIINGYYNNLSPGINIPEIATIMVVAVILLLLVNRVPGLLCGVLNGTSFNHSGIGAFGAAYGVGAALGAAAVASAASGMAGSVASAGAKHMGGAGQALQAAFKDAQQQLATQGNTSSGNASSDGLAATMGTGASFAAAMGKSLAKGTAGTLKDSASGHMGRFNAAASDTFPGKVASKISSSMAGDSKPSGAMPNAIGAKDEIAAFVDKNI